MRLRDRISSGTHSVDSNFRDNDRHNGSVGEGSSQGNNKSNEACRHFNQGYCKFGSSCRYEHKCSYCKKFGHVIFNCRKLVADKERALKRKQAKQKHEN